MKGVFSRSISGSLKLYFCLVMPKVGPPKKNPYFVFVFKTVCLTASEGGKTGRFTEAASPMGQGISSGHKTFGRVTFQGEIWG